MTAFAETARLVRKDVRNPFRLVTLNTFMNKKIVQCVRELRPGGGVCGVAFALEQSLGRAGVQAERFTINELGQNRGQDKFPNLYLKKTVLFFDVVYYTIVGTLIGLIKLRRKKVICHQNLMFGDIYINHGLHRAMLEDSGKKWSILFRNPVHPFTALCDYLRFNLHVHKYIVCFAQSEADTLTRYYPRTRSRIVIIPNGVDVERFRPDPETRIAERQKLGLSETDFNLIFVGHEYERKGLYPLIESLAHLPTRIKLCVIGGVDQEIKKGKLVATKNGVEDRVRFLGVVHQTEKIYNASDAMVLPSSMEAWPLVGLEAMSCGIPAIMTPVGGIPDYLVPGKNGLFISRNPQDIAAKIQALAAEPSLGEMKNYARKTALKFSWASVTQRYMALIEKIS